MIAKTISFLILAIAFIASTITYAQTRLTLTREDGSELVYYISLPKNQEHQESYCIMVLSEGSYNSHETKSILRLHNWVLPYFEYLPIALVSLEKYGIDGQQIDIRLFHEHNTRLQRIQDHELVVQALEKNSFPGWNKKFVFMGGSEGGYISTALAIEHTFSTQALIILAGLGAWSSHDEIWGFLQHMYAQDVVGTSILALFNDDYELFSRTLFDKKIQEILNAPTAEKFWFGQTYKYWADAFSRDREFNLHAFYDLKIPVLLVTGSKDPMIESCDALVEEATIYNTPITYWRIDDMSHNIKKEKPELFTEAAAWLQPHLK